MHRDDGVLQALLDGELDAVAAAEARAHAAECSECRTRLDSLRSDDTLVSHSLAALDDAVPVIPSNTVIARAGRSRALLRWAAAIALLLLGAGGLYAVPGSPLRRWIAALGGEHPQQRAAPTGPSAGIAIEPPGGAGAHFRIVVAPAPVASNVTITLTDGVTIDARRSEGTARFTAELDGLLIEPGAGPGDFAIDIPRTAGWVEVLVGRRRVFLKDGRQIVTEARRDSLGRYVFSFH
jgi:anti-sigma factor RsiW